MLNGELDFPRGKVCKDEDSVGADVLREDEVRLEGVGLVFHAT